MIHAYDEMYVDSAMNNLGDAFDYTACDLNMDKDEFLKLFISTGIAEEFGNGNPKYIMGMSGPELVEEVLNEAGIERLVPPSSDNINKHRDYWCGWILAFYQWYSKRPFSNIARHIKMSDIESMFDLYHEAPEEKFVDTVEKMIKGKNEPTRLQVIRKNCGITQNELAKQSGVSLRSIQMYEQRNKDINKAQMETVNNLAKVLGCRMEDLMEY